jgi:hypothetical protein
MSAPSSVFRPALFILLLLAAAVTLLSSQEENKVLVVSVAGDWKYEGKRVAFGQSLSNTGCLFATEGSIVLKPEQKDLAGQPFICDKPLRDPQCTGHEADVCAVPLNPGRWPKSGSGWGNTWDALLHLFVKEPEKYMVAASRGLEPGLEDAVVPKQAEGVNLASAFREMEAGHYWLQVSPVSDTPRPAKTFEVQFAAHGPAVITGSSIQPGLYRVVLVDKAGEPAGSDCWVLISAEQNFAATSRAFQGAQSDAAKWPDAMDPSAVRALLRAYLESLSISAQRSPS